MRKLFMLLSIVSLLALSLVSVMAQDDTISVGDSVTGNLTSTVLSTSYAIQSVAGDTLTITLSSDDFDAYLQLFSPELTVLASDDDSADGRNAGIYDFIIPADGRYVISVESYNQLSQGAFTLSVTGTTQVPQATDVPVEPTLAPTPVPIVTAGEILSGSAVTGTLSVDAPAVAYSFTGTVSEPVTFELTSNTIDTYLVIRDAAGNEIASDDDSAGNLNSRIADFTLPADGEYTVVATSFRGDAVGEFTLVFNGDGEVIVTPEPTPDTPVEATPTPILGSTEGDIVYGQSVAGTLTSDTLAAPFSFSGAAGDVITISADSREFDTLLILYDAGGVELSRDDDSGGNLNALIEGFSIPADGTYTVVVTSASGTFTGDFTLRLDSVDSGGSATPTVVSAGSIEPGALVTGSMAGSDVLYTFPGRSGQVVTMTLTSEVFDAYLVLRDSSGAEIASDDDSAGNLNARIRDLALPADGEYTIVVSSFTRNAVGDYSLSLEVGDVAEVTATPEATPEAVETPAADAAVVTGTLAGEPITHAITGTAGQVVTITLTSRDFDTFVILQNAAGDEITSDDDSAGNLNARIANFSLPDDGAYTIVVTSFSGSASGDYTLALEGAAFDE